MYFKYKVDWYLMFDPAKPVFKHNTGIVYGPTFWEAAKKIEESYGAENIETMEINYLSDEDVIEIGEVKEAFDE